MVGRGWQAQNLPREYRYILRDRAGRDLRHPVSGRPYVYPSYMAALRGAAMLDSKAYIVQQERTYDPV